MLEEKKLEEALHGGPWEGRVVCLPVTDSTNAEVRRRAAQTKSVLAVTAEEQTAGRGRRGRTWISPPGENLYFSALVRPDLPAPKAPMLTPAAALAVCRVLGTFGVRARIKWPNDVVIGARKVCGILTELQPDGQGGYCVVTGIGLNVNQERFPDSIASVATSLKRECGRAFERETLLADILCGLTDCFEAVCRTGDLSGLREEYESLLANRMRQVEVLDPAGSFMGTALGIDDSGRLLVRRSGGSVEAVFSGEVSVRGIYGYV